MKPVDPRLLRHARATRGFLAASVALGLAGAGLVVAQATLIAQVVVGAFEQGRGPGELVTPLVWLAAVSAGRAAVSWLTELAAHRTSAAVKSELRMRLLTRATRLGGGRPGGGGPGDERSVPGRSTGDRRGAGGGAGGEGAAAGGGSVPGGGAPAGGGAVADGRGWDTGELTTLATRGVDALDDYFARYLPQLGLAVVVPCAVLARIVTADWVSALIIAATLPLIPLFMVLIGWATQSRMDRQWRLLTQLSGHFLDVVAGLPTLKIFGRARAQAASIREITADHRRATLRTLRLAFLSSFALELLATLSVALVAVGIGMRLVHGDLDLATGLVVLILAPEAYLPLRQVGAHYHAAAEGLAAADRVFAVIGDGDGDVPGASGGIGGSGGDGPGGNGGEARLPGPGGVVLAVEGVEVVRPGRTGPALAATSFAVRAGETVALVGPSGSGKSTLLDTVLGLVPPTRGRVLVGGADLADLRPESWWRQVAWVPQRPYLFAGTVAENVRLARPDADDAAVREALRAAGALEFTEALPGGTEAVLGEGGGGLSAGQRQRLALARAFLADRPVLLLDEPTASLDGATEAAVVDAVRRLAAGRTVLLVVHRPALLAVADRVITIGGPVDGGGPGAADEAVPPAPAATGLPVSAPGGTGLPVSGPVPAPKGGGRSAAAGGGLPVIGAGGGGPATAVTGPDPDPVQDLGPVPVPYLDSDPVSVPAGGDPPAPAGRGPVGRGRVGDGVRGPAGEPAPVGDGGAVPDQASVPLGDGVRGPVPVEEERGVPGTGAGAPPAAVPPGPDARRRASGGVDASPGALLPLRREATRFALALLLGSLALGSAVGLMAVSGWLISRASEQPPVLHLMVAVTATRAFGIGRAVFRYAERLVSHDAALRVLAGTRVAVYRRLERLAPAGLRDTRRGDLLARVVGDVDALQDHVLRWLLPVGSAVVVGGASVAFTGWLLPEAGLVLAAGLLTAGVVVPAVSGAVARRAERRLAPARGALSTEVVDLLAGTAELTVAGALPRRLAAVRRADRILTGIARRAAAATATGAGLSALVCGLTVTAAAWAGSAAVADGRLSGVWLAAVVLTPLAAFEAVAGLPVAVQYRQRVRRSAQRVDEVLNAPEPVVDGTEPAPASPFPLVVEDLTARYPGAATPALRDFRLRLTAGRRVAVVGASGAGKTTVAQVLLRFLDAESGTYTLAGRDATALTGEGVRRLVGLCAQDAHLFHTSLRENLRLALPAPAAQPSGAGSGAAGAAGGSASVGSGTAAGDAGATGAGGAGETAGARSPAVDGGTEDERLRAALRAARLLEWVDGLPQGLDTPVGEFGARLSGGQRQRLALARALLADFPVLVLDEPAEHLDTATADALTADLLAATEGRTTVLITHRLAGLAGGAVDEVIVLAAGRVVQQGRYEELAATDGPFREMLAREHLVEAAARAATGAAQAAGGTARGAVGMVDVDVADTGGAAAGPAGPVSGGPGTGGPVSDDPVMAGRVAAGPAVGGPAVTGPE